jgi:hypothetical protein
MVLASGRVSVVVVVVLAQPACICYMLCVAVVCRAFVNYLLAHSSRVCVARTYCIVPRALMHSAARSRPVFVLFFRYKCYKEILSIIII